LKTLKCAAVLCATLALQAVQAANVVPNPDFDSDISGWTAGPGITWDGSDGSPGLGSLRISTAGNNATFSTCMVISAPQKIDLSANIRLRWGRQAGFQGIAYNDTNCSGYIAAFVTTLPPFWEFPEGWAQLSAAGVMLPDGTQSVVLAFIVLPNDSLSADASVDHVFFGPTADGEIFRNSFEL
jgi:hypothetical protein